MFNVLCKSCPTQYILFPVPSQRNTETQIKKNKVMKGRHFYEQIENFIGLDNPIIC